MIGNIAMCFTFVQQLVSQTATRVTSYVGTASALGTNRAVMDMMTVMMDQMKTLPTAVSHIFNEYSNMIASAS